MIWIPKLEKRIPFIFLGDKIEKEDETLGSMRGLLTISDVE